MNTWTKTAIAAVAICAFAGSATAQDTSIGLYSPETVGAAAYGSTDMIVHIPDPSQTRAQTVAPVDITNAPQITAAPSSGQVLDMSGADGSLRSCYENGGIAKQSQDLSYYCSYESQTQSASASPYITPEGVDTGYNGTNSVEDPALLDCVSRGGTLIQLAGNQQFACAM